MKSYIHKIIEKRKQKREAKLLAWRRSHIPYCIKDSDIKFEDLVPIGDEEYDRMVAVLEEKVKNEIGEEPRYITPHPTESGQAAIAQQESSADDFVSAMGLKYPRNIRRNGLPNVLAWREIVDSMKNRVRDAYYVTTGPCWNCGANNIIFFCFRSSDESWHELCGREGYMLICPDCLMILGFKHYILN